MKYKLLPICIMTLVCCNTDALKAISQYDESGKIRPYNRNSHMITGSFRVTAVNESQQIPSRPPGLSETEWAKHLELKQQLQNIVKDYKISLQNNQTAHATKNVTGTISASKPAQGMLVRMAAALSVVANLSKMALLFLSNIIML